MSPLPTLVVHGWWISKVLLLFATALLFATVVVIRRWVVRSRSRGELAALAKNQTTTLREGVVVLRGVIHGRLATRFHPNAEKELIAESIPTAGACLDSEGTRVELLTPVVRQGTMTTTRWWGMARTSMLPDKRHVHPGPRLEHSVGDGDEVFVRGSITRDADRWSLTGDIYATRAKPCPAALGPRLPVIVIALGLFCYFAFRIAGNQIVDTTAAMKRASDAPLEEHLREFEPLVIASALPGARAAALKELEYRLATQIGRSEIAVSQRAALAELQHGCAAALRVLIAADRYEEAIARNCGANQARGEALLALGRFEEAAVQLDSESPTRFVALIALRRWSDAAIVVERLAISNPDDAEGLRCLAEVVRGDAAGSRNRAASACEIARALVRPENERVDALVEVAISKQPGDAYREAAVHLATMFGLSRELDPDSISSLLQLTGRVEPWVVGFPSVAESSGTLAWRVHRQVHAGDFEAAGRAVEKLARLNNGSYIPRDLDLALQLRQGQVSIDTTRVSTLTVPTLVLKDELALRRGLLGDASREIASRCTSRHEQTLDAALQGDGSPLATLIEDCHVYASTASYLLTVAPFVRKGLDRLASASATAIEPVTRAEVPFAIVEELAFERDVANALGARRIAIRSQEIIDRHLTAFATREQLAALLLWRAMSHYHRY